MWLLRVLIGSLDFLCPLWLARVITLVLVLRHLVENRSILMIHSLSCLICDVTAAIYWCSKTMKWRPFWWTKAILWDLNSFLVLKNFCCSNKILPTLRRKIWKRNNHRRQKRFSAPVSMRIAITLSVAILDLCLRKTRADKSPDYRDIIIFEKLRFQNVFRPTFRVVHITSMKRPLNVYKLKALVFKFQHLGNSPVFAYSAIDKMLECQKNRYVWHFPPFIWNISHH